jgi:hypothetical protein
VLHEIDKLIECVRLDNKSRDIRARLEMSSTI